MFLKADKTLCKLNFLLHLKSKTNLVTLRKCHLHLQYYKIHLSFSIKLQEINLYVCGEYKTVHEARGPNRRELEARQSNRALKFASCAPGARWECAREAHRFLHFHHMRSSWFYVKNHFRNFHHIFTFWDPLSQKKRFLRKCLSVRLSVCRSYTR